ncbi:MAG: hypothetical protein ACREFE_06410 [Limisphaerales bacterium]
MKKIVLILFFALVGFSIWLLLKKSIQSPSTPTQEANQALSPRETNLFTSVSNVVQTTAVSEPINPSGSSINALAATNLDQWKTLIKGLHKAPNSEFWVMEQTNRLAGIPVLFEQNSKTISYKVRFIDVELFNDGRLMEVEMHSPIMNIDETRELGLQLCDMLQIDPKGFSEWCDKVGNHWLDAPLYSTKSNAHLSFRVLMTYNNQRPWYINFVIQ